MAEEERTFEVGPEDENSRLDLFLVKYLKGELSRSRVQELIRSGFVLLDEKTAKPHTKLKAGQRVSVEFRPKPALSLEPQDIPVEVLYEDDDLIVVNKPSGMVVHPAPGNSENTLVNALLFHTGLSSLGLPLRPGVVHRLDKEVSGVMVLAKTDFAYLDLAKQFRQRTVTRKYIALVKGEVEFDEGEILLPIARHPIKRKRMAVGFLKSKEAKTRYKVLKRFKEWTMLELTLGTGRTHQIRVHMSYIGYPILGDEKYGEPCTITVQGSPCTVMVQGRRGKFARIMLHAKKLGFHHPRKKENMEFQSPLPEEMARLM